MFQSKAAQKTRPVGYNRPVKDCLELCGVFLHELPSLLGISVDECIELLFKEIPDKKKLRWTLQIFWHADQNLYFSTWPECEEFIRQEIIRHGPEWMESQTPPLIEGSSRHFHQQLNKFRPSRQEEEQNEKYN